MDAVKAKIKMFSLFPSKKVPIRDQPSWKKEVELRMKMNSDSWYNKSRRWRDFTVYDDKEDINVALLENAEDIREEDTHLTARRHTLVGHVEKMRMKFELRQDKRLSISTSRSLDKVEEKPSSCCYSQRMIQTAEALQRSRTPSVSSSCSSSEDEDTIEDDTSITYTPIPRKLSTGMEPASMVRAAWNRDITKTVRIRQDNWDILKQIKIFSPNSLQPPPPNVHCIAEHSYTANHPDELNLQRGDILLPMVMLEAGWWVGSLVLPIQETRRNMLGVFPSNYVKCFRKRRITNLGSKRRVKFF